MACCMAGSAYGSYGKFYEPEVDSSTAQFVLFTSMQKLDQAKRSRGGIRLHQGLLIAVTALKARQLLWQRNTYFHTPLEVDPVIKPPPQSTLSARSDVPLTTDTDHVLPSCESVLPIANPVWPPLSTEDYFSFAKASQDHEMNDVAKVRDDDPSDDSDCPLDSMRSLCFASDSITGPVNVTPDDSSPMIESAADTTDIPASPPPSPADRPVKRTRLDYLFLTDYYSPVPVNNCSPHTHTSVLDTVEFKRPCLEFG